jgi:hypothetical protein
LAYIRSSPLMKEAITTSTEGHSVPLVRLPSFFWRLETSWKCSKLIFLPLQSFKQIWHGQQGTSISYAKWSAGAQLKMQSSSRIDRQLMIAFASGLMNALQPDSFVIILPALAGRMESTLFYMIPLILITMTSMGFLAMILGKWFPYLVESTELVHIGCSWWKSIEGFEFGAGRYLQILL